MPNHRLLIFDADTTRYAALRERYGAAYDMQFAESFGQGLSAVKKKTFECDALIYDIKFTANYAEHAINTTLPQLAQHARRRFPIIVVGNDIRPDVRTKISKIGGISLVLSKAEQDDAHWDAEIQRVIQAAQQAPATAPQTGAANQSDHHPNFVVVSPAMEAIKTQVEALSRYTHVPVLIRGESGVGKEIVARMLHQAKGNPDLPLKTVNLSALGKELILSELFGHVRGAFTGAERDKEGYFVAAKNGTLFLDEIGEISTDIQVQLLTALENRSFQPVGSNESLRLEAQLVFATNADLESKIAAEIGRAHV